VKSRTKTRTTPDSRLGRTGALACYNRHFRFDDLWSVASYTNQRALTIPRRMDLASKHPPGGPNRDAGRDAADALTDTPPTFRPLFAMGA